MNRYLKHGWSIVLIAFTFGLTTAVLANGFYTQPPAPVEAPYFTGPYVGIGIGLVGAHADVNAEGNVYLYNSGMQQIDYINHLNKSHNFDIGKFGFNGNIFAGYGKTFESFPSYYIGGEMFGNYFGSTLNGTSYSLGGSNQDPLYVTSINTSVKSPYSIGGDMRIGYIVAPRTMVYGLLGIDYARFDVKSEFAYHTFIQPELDGHFAHDFSKWKLGYMPGVGIETVLIDNISLRAQYTYTYYSSFSYSTTLGYDALEPGPPPHKVNLTTKVKPSRGLFTVKLSYLFN